MAQNKENKAAETVEKPDLETKEAVEVVEKVDKSEAKTEKNKEYAELINLAFAQHTIDVAGNGKLKPEAAARLRELTAKFQKQPGKKPNKFQTIFTGEVYIRVAKDIPVPKSDFDQIPETIKETLF